MEFRKRKGPLWAGTRLENGFALVAQVVNNSAGGKAGFADFLPKWGAEDPNPPIESVFGLLQSAARRNKEKPGGGS